MIARLSGRLDEKLKDRVIINVNGVGYLLSIPTLVLQRLPNTGNEITLEVYTHVREDAILLFGFSTREEREIFELLLGADGVGPKLALAILSNLELRQIIATISAGNAFTLTAVPGVGKKLAEKIIISLQDKFQKINFIPEPKEAKQVDIKIDKRAEKHTTSWYNDLREALFNLGFKEPDVRIVLNDVLGREKLPADFSVALKLCLQKLNQPRWNIMKGMA